ncbi:threonine/homoserine/homoserine lactone efflux protein [Methanolinea mesophila]|uniref:LysE family transporter n=1 Tax=Methanolinea mesophila TaxID=547055 RepID=UPI001AE22F6F|nr:LysE family transporter [Methanolinea mesophila]MBP1929750.1 threonine/homoserine/homoserine lactone efflux protein [Methanolinea mesophila]
MIDLFGLFILGLMIGFTGAIAPGPTLIATIHGAVKGGWVVGPGVTFGHVLVEILMVLLVIGGLSVFIGQYSWIIAIVGGGALLVFGILTLLESRHAEVPETESPKRSGSPVLAGVVTSISNPYFWIWWLTVGSALLIGALAGGIASVLAFIAGHWAADLIWYTVVAASMHKGKFLLGKRGYRAILGICGIFLIGFGVFYLISFRALTG